LKRARRRGWRSSIQPTTAAGSASGNGGLYRQKFTHLARALEHPDTRTEAADRSAA
jgi:hypothetical protein